jgi:hypothetical protein
VAFKRKDLIRKQLALYNGEAGETPICTKSRGTKLGYSTFTERGHVLQTLAHLGRLAESKGENRGQCFIPLTCSTRMKDKRYSAPVAGQLSVAWLEIARAHGGLGSARDFQLSFRRSSTAIFPTSLAPVLREAGECARAGTCGGSARTFRAVLLAAAIGGSGSVTPNFRPSDPAKRQRISTAT